MAKGSVLVFEFSFDFEGQSDFLSLALILMVKVT